ADHVTVRVFDLHFESPGVIGRGHADDDSLGLAFLVKLVNIFYADPDPSPAAALVASAKIDCGAVARHAGEIIGAPAHVGEPQPVHVKPEAGLHVFHAQDRLATLKAHTGLSIFHAFLLQC